MAPTSRMHVSSACRIILLVLTVVAIESRGTTAQQDPEGNIGVRLYEKLSPHCLDADSQQLGDEFRCAYIVGVATSHQLHDSFQNLVQPCCRNVTAAPPMAGSENCLCAFVQASAGLNLAVDGVCDLTAVRGRCKARDAAAKEAARREEARRREEALRKLGACDRLVQRLIAGEVPKLRPLDVPACGVEILRCKTRCLKRPGELATCDGLVQQLRLGAGQAFRVRPTQAAACGIELFKCKQGSCKKQ
ncbi:hypothetical protein ACP4OV_007287 [Aristida adscensionis]